ncbi:antitoxin Xre-like helix-turn-helix domain-containing protein [Gluconacetobacter sacchari]|uniref:DUF2384 domain-containing protein n=1 Tax=Gluconacetobacter sacchari TaxID=92759 RepID=A0A7W4NPH9_9PROT|nr:antitoxin Xre-like helix-turn-helix domain-containing protein [Gluconacetobacter sacchari]MBB2161607.1 DUF2384 domain-containing protein [Gluconacetobacter sacchari]
MLSDTIDAVLGVPGIGVHSRLGLVRSIEEGLPVSALDSLVSAIAPDDAQFKYRLVPKATLERRRRSSNKLTPEEGDNVARLAKVYAFALSIYRSPEQVRTFMARPHMMLENRAPIDVAVSNSAGSDAVINLLGRAAYGGGV